MTFCPELTHLGGLAKQSPGRRALGRSEVLSSFTFPVPSGPQRMTGLP